jgi:predicted SprT family Zn-dependent metalloprotease
MNKTLQIKANTLWVSYAQILPNLAKFECPKIIINNRTYRTAGQCIVGDNEVQLSGKLLTIHYDRMLSEILPHELIHQIDYNFNKKVWTIRNAHSKRWVDIGVKLGIELHTYHTLEYIK